MQQQRMTIVRGDVAANRNGDNHRSYKPIRGLLRYVAFGRYWDSLGSTPQGRGVWRDHNGTPQKHEMVVEWAKQKVNRFKHEYAYQLLLSTRHGGLEDEDFRRAMQAGRDISKVYDWRLMVHHDTKNQHAHAVLFRSEKLQAKEYKTWQRAMQGELDHWQVLRRQEQLEQLLVGQQGQGLAQ